jgi:hypothetical protein
VENAVVFKEAVRVHHCTYRGHIVLLEGVNLLEEAVKVLTATRKRSRELL